MGNNEKDVLLDVKNLKTYFKLASGTARAVDGVSFQLRRGETLGVVGESGSGKSVMAKSVIRLLENSARIEEGSITFEGRDVLSFGKKELRDYRGRDIGMIFQDPMTSLDPVFKVGKQMTENLRIHRNMNKAEAREVAINALRSVGIPNPEARFESYPFELSGGMCQRVIIAMALCCNAEVIIADEPTTALDVTIQAQILDLLRNLKDQINSSIMFITHDLGVIAEMADYVVVMYAGRIVEQGTAEEIFAHPAHPYTIGLMASKPVVGRQVDKLYSIPGKVPNPINMPNYCYFKDRCEMCVNGCEGDYPCEVSISPTHKVSCYRYYDGKRPDLEEVVEEELAEGKENGKEGE